MGNGNGFFVRMVICALLAVGAWNLGIIVSRTFIFDQPYTVDPLINLILPMILGCVLGAAWKPKAK